MAALFDAAIGLRVRNGSYRARLHAWQEEISNQVATLALKAMVKAGLLLQRGASSGTYYVAAPTIREIAVEIRSSRTPIDSTGLFTPG